MKDKDTSLVSRLARLQQLLAGILIVVFAGSAVWLSARTMESQEDDFLSNAAKQMVVHFEREMVEEGNLQRAAQMAIEEGGHPGVHFEIHDDQGRVIFALPMPRGLAPEERRVARAHDPRGVWIVATMSTRPRRTAVTALAMALILTGIPLFLLVTAASRAVARRALAPLSRMATQAEEGSERGEPKPLGHPSDPSEVRALASSFNRLLERLDQMLTAERHFTQDAAHELRTPLTVVSGEIEYALSNPSLTPPTRHGLTHAFEQTKAMADLVEALLFLRRADPRELGRRADFGPVNVADLVREISQDLLERACERRHDLVIDAPDEAMVAGHSILLSSAVRNLLSNALKFTEPGQAVRAAVTMSGDQCLLVVEDAGRGIPPEERERIFDAFHRSPEARATHEGFGLGLPILRRVAQAHGGDVAATASAMGGARFELRLPAWTPRD